MCGSGVQVALAWLQRKAPALAAWSALSAVTAILESGSLNVRDSKAWKIRYTIIIFKVIEI
jgi:hypothetical protein